MQYTQEDFKIRRTSKDICGSYGIAFYGKKAVWYKHKCNRLDCPSCRDDYIQMWGARVSTVFDNPYMVNIQPSQLSSIRHKYSKIPYIVMRFNGYYTIIIDTEIKSSIPIKLEAIADIIETQKTYVKNFITANRAFHKKLSCHVLHNKDIDMQKVARGKFLGRAVRPLEDDSPKDIVDRWNEYKTKKEKANTLKMLHVSGTLRLTEVGKEYVALYATKDPFHLDRKVEGFVLDERAVVIFESRDYIGYIIPEKE